MKVSYSGSSWVIVGPSGRAPARKCSWEGRSPLTRERVSRSFQVLCFRLFGRNARSLPTTAFSALSSLQITHGNTRRALSRALHRSLLVPDRAAHDPDRELLYLRLMYLKHRYGLGYETLSARRSRTRSRGGASAALPWTSRWRTRPPSPSSPAASARRSSRISTGRCWSGRSKAG